MKLLNKKLVALILLFISVDVFSQPKPPGTNNNGALPTFNDHRLRRGAPVSPATFLLLGLGVTAVGAKIYRNKKQ